MVIGFDAKRIVRNATGLGSYGRTLVNDLAVTGGLNLRLYAPDEGRDDLRNQVVKLPNVNFCYPSFHNSSSAFLPVKKALWRSYGIVKTLKQDGVQLYHGLSGELPVGIHKSGIKSVVTIHDLIFLRHPEYYNRVDVHLYRWKFWQALKEADHIVAISDCTRRDIIELGEVQNDSRISVIYQSFAPRFSAEVSQEVCKEVRMRYGLPQRFILNVGTIEPRKNVLLAAKALKQLPKDLALVIVGRRTSYTNEILEYIGLYSLSHRVFMLHDVPDADLPALYAQAECFVYPSRYEGFGIPIVEAISCGLPVVACTGSCLEEAGGPDSLYVGPDDANGMAAAISQVLHGANGRDERIRRSQQYIQRFANASTAQQYKEIYSNL